MFQLPPNKETGLKILTPKQMLQTLPILLAKVKEINLSENLLNETRQIKYFLYWANAITKKVYNSIMNSTKGVIQNGYYIDRFWNY